mgnify:CR=1 FL=1
MTTDFMKYKGIRRISGYMFRYIYPLNKKAKRLMEKESTLDWTKNYPKDKDLKWIDDTDRKNKIYVDKPAFTFQDAKYNLKNINAHKEEVNLNLYFRIILNFKGFFTFFLLTVNSIEVPTGPLINLTASIKDFPWT